MKRYVFAMTGASGAPYGLRVVGELVKSAEIHVVCSPTALDIMRDETGVDWSARDEKSVERKVREHLGSERVHFWESSNLAAPVSSGSFSTDGMLVVPCSMKSLAGIANGYAVTLIERAADVTLKEGRRLLLAPREMPLSALHLDNMLKLARMGAVIAPPIPAFYHRPDSLEGVVDFVAGKILDAMGIEHNLFPRWGDAGPG